MDWFEKVKRYFVKGYYANNDVKIFVKGNKITEEQYKVITGEEYLEEI